MLIVTIGALWIVLAGGCTLVFFGWPGLDFLRDAPKPPPQRYRAGYDLMVMLGSIPVGAVGVAVGMVILWTGLSIRSEADGKVWMRRTLLLLGGVWTLLGVLAVAASLWRPFIDGNWGAPSDLGPPIIIAVAVLGPGVLMLLGGATKLWGRRPK
jgi:hypothetical protein